MISLRSKLRVNRWTRPPLLLASDSSLRKQIFSFDQRSLQTSHVYQNRQYQRFVWMTSHWSINLHINTSETWSFYTYSFSLSQGSHRSAAWHSWCEFESVPHLSRVDSSRGKWSLKVYHHQAAQSAGSSHLCISSFFSRSYSSVGQTLDTRFRLRFHHH